MILEVKVVCCACLNLGSTCNEQRGNRQFSNYVQSDDSKSCL